MSIFIGCLYVVEVLVCLMLALVVMLQKPKEGGLGGAIGGGIGIILMDAEGVLRQENGFGWLPRIICVLLCAIVPYILLSNQQKTKLRTATEKAKKHYGRFDNAAKYIIPRNE